MIRPPSTPAWTAPRATSIARWSKNWPWRAARASWKSRAWRTPWRRQPGPARPPRSSQSTARARQMRRRGRGWTCRRPHTWATTCWTTGARRSRTGWATGPRRDVRLARSARRHPAVVYLGPIALLTLLMLAAAAVYAAAQGGSAFSRFWPLRWFSCRRWRPRWPWSIGLSPWLCRPGFCPSSISQGNKAPMGYPTHAAHWWWCRRC